MSRSATALAYDSPSYAPPQAGGSHPPVRLLGGGGTRTHYTYPNRTEPPGSLRLISAALEAPTVDREADDWEAYAPAPQAADALARLRVVRPAWLLGTTGAMLALAAVMLPTIFPARGHAPRRIMLPVAAAEVAVAATGDHVTIIDTTTQPDVAPPVAQPAQSGTGGDYSITGAPTISVAQIESVLAQYGSPAVGKGQALYDLGVRYGINPAFGLAFFVHESGCGTKGVARVTHSLGNIRWTSGFDNYEGYRAYPGWEAGMEDWYKLMTDLYINGWGLRTVDAIVPVYAPYGDNNNPPVYIQAVKSMVDSWRGK